MQFFLSCPKQCFVVVVVRLEMFKTCALTRCYQILGQRSEDWVFTGKLYPSGGVLGWQGQGLVPAGRRNKYHIEVRCKPNLSSLHPAFEFGWACEKKLNTYQIENPRIAKPPYTLP